MTSNSKCMWSRSCKGKATHMILTKHGDFPVCAKHAKMAEKNKAVRFITGFGNPNPRGRRNPGSVNATLKCNFCGKVFKKKIGPRYEVKCPKCGEYDVDVISYVPPLQLRRNLALTNPPKKRKVTSKKTDWKPIAAVVGIAALIWYGISTGAIGRKR